MPISIDGADELTDRLRNLNPGLLDAAKQGTESAMQQMKADAVANCPVDTGALRGSIQTEVGMQDGALRAKLYSPMEYAGFVEMGTGPKGEAAHAGIAPDALTRVTYRPDGWVYHDEKGFHHTNGQPARPFLYPAFKANRVPLLNAIREAIRARLKGG